jgi:hypothetical protein
MKVKTNVKAGHGECNQAAIAAVQALFVQQC